MQVEIMKQREAQNNGQAMERPQTGGGKKNKKKAKNDADVKAMDEFEQQSKNVEEEIK